MFSTGFTGQTLAAASFFLTTVLSIPCQAETIKFNQLDSAPTLDGKANDWSSVTAVSIPLKNNNPKGKSDINKVSLKSGVHGDSLFFLLEWKDGSHDNHHKPFVWDAGKNKYVSGKQREDRLAIQFGMSGDYDVNWMSGKLFTADTWHWKAARSNGLGIAQDKMTVVRNDKAKKAYKGTASNGSTIYIQRPSDEGSKLYTTKRYSTKVDDLMPKYILASSASGSVADVKAKGVWANGQWTLELSRKLSTGNNDDVAFQQGQSVQGGIAVFNHTGDDDHNVSEQLTFQY